MKVSGYMANLPGVKFGVWPSYQNKYQNKSGVESDGNVHYGPM